MRCFRERSEFFNKKTNLMRKWAMEILIALIQNAYMYTYFSYILN